MAINRVLLGLTLGAVVLALLPADAQRGSGTMPLSADDHMQIQQLVTQSSRALSTGTNSRPFLSNVIITATDRGAAATYYEVLFAVGQDGKQSTITRTGRYQDTYTKTATGWRIQKRDFFPAITTPEADKAAIPEPPVSGGQQPSVIVERQRTGTPTALTALDYLEIQRLVASYGHALDNGLGW